MQRSRRFYVFRLFLDAGFAVLAHTQAINPHFTNPNVTNIIVTGDAHPQSNRVADAFVSYSIEFGSLPYFAGNPSNPNILFNNLIDNVAQAQGSRPILRIGGTTQDSAIFDETLPVATRQADVPPGSPPVLYIGPQFFNSYRILPPEQRITHGFNLANRSAVALRSLLNSIPIICNATAGASPRNHRVVSWELGNEPNLYSRTTEVRAAVRPPTYNAVEYVEEWRIRSQQIARSIVNSPGCMSYASTNYKYMAPSFSGTDNNSMDLQRIFDLGLNESGLVGLVSTHYYLTDTQHPNLTLSSTLLNHTALSASLQKHTAQQAGLQRANESTPLYTLSEANSFPAGTGDNLSNTFGAALWTLDFLLSAASINIFRVHMHNGPGSAHNAFQPFHFPGQIDSPSTRPAYYGQLAAATFLGNLSTSAPAVHVSELPLHDDRSAAYAAYTSGRGLSRLAVLNLLPYSYSRLSGTSSRWRPIHRYSLAIPHSCPNASALVYMLSANGSNVLSDVSFNATTFSPTARNGRGAPARNPGLNGAILRADLEGRISLDLPSSSAAILDLDCSGAGGARFPAVSREGGSGALTPPPSPADSMSSAGAPRVQGAAVPADPLHPILKPQGGRAAGEPSTDEVASGGGGSTNRDSLGTGSFSAAGTSVGSIGGTSVGNTSVGGASQQNVSDRVPAIPPALPQDQSAPGADKAVGAGPDHGKGEAAPGTDLKGGKTGR